jgi:NAD(P)-dependent dehydrogenase (short-subunit alcohol dehydrogenase family)
MAVILITGGAGGLGVAIADRLADQGDVPVIADVDLGRAERAAAGIDGATAVQLDVTDSTGCWRVIDGVVERNGRIDGVVCAAAIFAFEPALDVGAADFARTLEVNVSGTFYICQAAARAMIASGHGGSMVLFSSGAASRSVGAPAYSASKGAVESLTRELALAWAAHGIRVNAVAPGVIDTEMSRAAKEDPETMAWLMAHTPLGRMGRPDEIAATVSFLLSDASSYVSASVVPTDGGFLSR